MESNSVLPSVNEKPNGAFASVTDLLTDEVSGTTRDIQLPNGKWITLRGMSRAELLASGKGTDDIAEMEVRNITACLVRPAMTRAQVAEWQRNSGPATMAAVTSAIRELSGLGKGAEKSAVPESGD